MCKCVHLSLHYFSNKGWLKIFFGIKSQILDHLCTTLGCERAGEIKQIKIILIPVSPALSHPKGSPVPQTVKHLPTMQENQVQSLGREDPLEKEMATHSSILAWKIPWLEERGRLQSVPWGCKESDMTAISLHFTMWVKYNM